MRYIAYNADRRDSRGWLVIEEDGTDDGRLVCSGMTEADCRTVVDLLNRDAGCGATASNKPSTSQDR